MALRQSHGTDAEAGASTDPSDRNLFPSVSEPPPDDESALAAASVLDESSDRPAELSDVWWRRLNEVTQPMCLHKTVDTIIVSILLWDLQQTRRTNTETKKGSWR